MPPYFQELLLYVLGPFQGQTLVVQTQDLNTHHHHPTTRPHKVCYLYVMAGRCAVKGTGKEIQLNGWMPARAKGKGCTTGRTWSWGPEWRLHMPVPGHLGLAWSWD